MAVRTIMHPLTQRDQSINRSDQVNVVFRRSSLCLLPFIWPHLGVIGCTLLTGLMICMATTQIILSDYKCPKCGMQLDYNRPFDEPQSCQLCGRVVTNHN